MPTVSAAQHRAMEAAAHGHSKLGIPKKVGEEFVVADATGGNAAGVLFVADDGDILLMRRAADEPNYGGYWGLPGGKAEEGESPIAAARREVIEETGFDCADRRLKIFDSVVTPNKMAFHTYACGIDEKFAPKMADGEHQGYAWFSIDGLPAKTHPSIVRALKERLALSEDMTPEDWQGLRDGFVKWTREEGAEPEHAGDAKLSKQEVDYSIGKGESRCKNCAHFEAPNACELVAGVIDPDYWCKRFSLKAAQDDPAGKLSEKERAEADRDHASREEMPGSAFLEPTSRKYPVKTKVNGEWRYSRDLLLAAAREARMHHHEELADRADAIRERMSSGANDAIALDWAIKVEDVKRALAPRPIAFDRKSVRRYDGDNRLHVEATNISKANVCEYLGSEIPDYAELGLQPDKLYRLYRDPEELAKGAATFNNLPLLSRHVPVDARDHQPNLVVGSTGTDAVFEAPYLKNSLVVWAGDAIDDIESDAKKELSSAYRYRADMTPGKAPDGESYDGVMRDIVGNHVAIVKEGRAGPDVVVGDSKETILMSKTAPVKMTRTAASVLGVLSVNLRPKLAQDAKFDLVPIIAKLTPANFKTSKADIANAIAQATKGKLAKDASLEDVTGLLDALERADIPDGADEIEVNTAPEESMDAGEGAIKDFLKGKLSDEDYTKACALLGNGASDEEDEEAEKKRKEEEARKTAADVEAKVAEKTKDMVSKSAMDEAIKVAVDGERKRQRDVRDAEDFVRPWVGKLAMAHDSAVGVLQAAAQALSIEDADKINDATALRAVIKVQPLPGSSKKPQPAMDAATEKSFAERFPHAAKIGVVA